MNGFRHPHSSADLRSGKSRSRPSGGRRAWVVVVSLLLLAALGRAFLPSAVQDYVNRTLDRNPLYEGRIGAVHLHLWRGAYSVDEITISKKTGATPVPFFTARRISFAVDWKNFAHGKVVARMEVDGPRINFVDAPSDGDTQTGRNGSWLVAVQDLFPFRINHATIQDGSVHFHSYQAATPVDVYISRLAATIDNLTNIRDETNPLIATVQATGYVMDQAKFDFTMALDPFSYRPSFHLATRLMGLDVTKLNDLALAYGKFNFKRGWFDLVLEADVKEGQVTGYAKPLFRNLQVFKAREDLTGGDVLQFFWQALVGGVTKLFRNQNRDQFGTLIPFHGEVDSATTLDLLTTVGNILRNAFVRAYLPRLEGGQESPGDLHFQTPELTDPVSPADPSK